VIKSGLFEQPQIGKMYDLSNLFIVHKGALQRQSGYIPYSENKPTGTYAG
jgi:hypothetical protein